jgi:hypothetical protein
MFLTAASGRGASAGRTIKQIGRPVIDSDGIERTTFRNHRMELFLWRANGLTKAFELHYGIGTENEWSMLWTERGGISFHRLVPNSGAPVMIPVEPQQLPICDLHAEFVVRSRLIDEPIRRIVLIQLSKATRNYGIES